MNKYRTHNCSELNEENQINKDVCLSGWLHEKRSWKFTFVDLRDHYL